MKKTLAILLSAVLLFAAIPLGAVSVSAAKYDGFTYTVSDGKVTITDYTASESGIATIPSSIAGYPVTAIDSNAFYLCWDLTSVSIPASVVSIADGAFGWSTNLTTITVDKTNPNYCDIDGVLFDKAATTLMAFPGGRTGEYTVPSGVATIKSDAFDGAKITSVVIPSSVTTIERFAFAGCKMMSVTLSKGVKTVGYGAFYLCDQLKTVYYTGNSSDRSKVTIEKSNTELTAAIWQYNFHIYSNDCDAVCNDCGAIREVIGHVYDDIADRDCNVCGVIRDDVSGITGDCTWTYDYNTKILVVSGEGEAYNRTEWRALQKEAVIFEEGVTYVGGSSYIYTYGDVKLLVIPSTLTGCSGEAFMVGAKTVILNSAAIASRATVYDAVGYLFFQNTTVLIADSITTVGGYATNSKTYTSSVTVNGKPYRAYSKHYHTFTDAPADRFDGEYCQSCRMPQDRAPGGLVYEIADGEVTITGYTNTLPAELVIPSTINDYPVTAIGTRAFYECSQLRSVIIPAGVTSIGTRAFANCNYLTTIEVSEDNRHYSAYDGVLFNKDKTVLICCPASKSDSYVIPSGVTTVNAYAFSGCWRIYSVTIPSSVTEIESYAFPQSEVLLSDVYYMGYQCQQNNIAIGQMANYPLIHATWHYEHGNHWYDDDCDALCNACGLVREVSHTYDHACDTDCNVCGNLREISGHVYDNDKDADCNECGAVREVMTVLLGDVNGDGRVNNRDLGLFQQYLADMDVTIDLDVANVNGDSRVNNRDLGLLQQYLADMDVTLG